ncbi:hypothetical protein CWE08_01685 [Aliidiomarina iranensis]|uniref:Cytochrome oxidase assembly protein n=1 Tax=Aliidiomarina iranensis TaxID=1434071 RepID=A0A432W2C7_9GAMM|nr:hypothetical protein [Aliidiomarina iranensis]RUO23387.1 hypothetical protein CWE08_01685 [Aliidiomarina iranensis]
MTPEEKKVKRKSQRVLIIVALIFVLPLAAAKLVLSMGWYETGVSNKGNLVTPEIQLSEAANVKLPATWRIAYRMPAECSTACENSLYVASQLHHALGRQQERVQPVAIAGDTSAGNLPTLPADSTLQLVHAEEAHAALANIPEHALVIIDPVGSVVLWYAGSEDRRDTVMNGRDLLRDLQKLLKLSRVG